MANKSSKKSSTHEATTTQQQPTTQESTMTTEQSTAPSKEQAQQTVTATQQQPQTSSKASALDSIAEGYGFATFWKNVSFGYKPVSFLTDVLKNAPLQSFVEFAPHTAKQAIQLACSDGSLKKVKYNDEKVEARLVHFDEQAKLYTVEFLGYEKVNDKKGKRTQIDTVSIQEDGSVLNTGSTDVGATFLSLFQKHLDNWTGNDVYLQVIRPYLSDMKAFRLSTSNYYVTNTTSNVQKLAELRLFLEQIGFQLFTLTQAKDTLTQQALTTQVEDMLGDRIADVQSKVEEWKSKNRVHGRSEKAVLDELASILADAKELESSLETELQSIKDHLHDVEQEAVAILSSQAPKDYNPLCYDYFKSVIDDETNVTGTTEFGDIYMVSIGQDNKDFFTKSGSDVKKYVKRVLHGLGKWAFVTSGLCIIRPLGEIESMSVKSDQVAK